MDGKPTHRLTIHLDSGKSIVTEECFESDEDVEEEVVSEIESRESPWKCLGHVQVNFRNIVAVEIEEIGAAPTTTGR